MLGNNRAISGRYCDQLLDDCSRHSIAIREPAAATQDQLARQFVIDYFYHRGAFWTAVVPLDGVHEILGQAFNFSKVKTRPGDDGPQPVYDSDGVPKRRLPMLNHLQSRFRLKAGQTVDLYPLHSDPDGQPRMKIDDFVYSVEAVGPPGVNFSLRDGINGSLISAHRFLSTEEMVFERIVCERQYVLESASLPLDDVQKRTLLVTSLRRSHRAGMSEVYYLYRCGRTNNCTSNPFQLLDKSVDYSWRQWLGAMLFRLPISPRSYLRVRGMDADPDRRHLVRDEFADFISSPETQKRKRAAVKARVRQLRAARAAKDNRTAVKQD